MKLFLDTNILEKDFNKFSFKNTFRFKVFGDIYKRECIYNNIPSASPINKDSNVRNTKLKFIKKKKKLKSTRQQGNLNTGRWTEDEHRKLIEAMFKHGTKWGAIVKNVGTRSGTQARSHTQKFILKLKKHNALNTNDEIDAHSLIAYYKALNDEDKHILIEYLSNFEYVKEEININNFYEYKQRYLNEELQSIDPYELNDYNNKPEDIELLNKVEFNDINEINYLGEIALSQYQNLDNFLNNIIENKGSIEDLSNNQDLIYVIEQLINSNHT